MTGKGTPVKKFIVAVAFAFLTLPLSAATITKPLAPATAWPLPLPSSLASIIIDAAAPYHVDPNLIAAMAFQESRFNPNAVSRIGAQGVLQLIPETAHDLGVTNAFDARQNIFGGTTYIAQLLQRFNGNVEMALAAYNAGPKLVEKVGPRPTAEAIDYVQSIKAYYANALAAL